MKPNLDERNNLARRIQVAHLESGLSVAKIARLCGIDAGHASRILHGKFATLSASVMQICTVLGVDPRDLDQAAPFSDNVAAVASWVRLEASIRRAWDRTPQGADRLVRVIEAVAEATQPER